MSRCTSWQPSVGTVYDWLTTIAPARWRLFSTRRHGHWFVRVRCCCGTEKDVRVSSLRSGVTKSCGCQRPRLVSQARLKGAAVRRERWQPGIIAGQRFGELTVIKAVEPGEESAWVRCSCGNVRHARQKKLLNGTVTACWGHRHSKNVRQTNGNLRIEVPA